MKPAKTRSGKSSKSDNELGKFVVSLCNERGISIRDLATKMKRSISLIKRMVNGKKKSFHPDTVRSLAKSLSIELSLVSGFMSRKEKDTDSLLGQMIRSRRRERGILQAALARMLNISRQFMSQIESGKASLAEGEKTLKNISRVLKIDLGSLKAVRLKRGIKKVKSDTPLGRFLIARRLELRLLQYEAAKLAGIKHTDYSRIEKGVRAPSQTELCGLTRALKCQVPEYLIH